MHSRIFQISKNSIGNDDYITEDRYYDGFCGEVADYVDGDTDRDNDIKWLKDALGGSVEFDGDKFTIVNKRSYFKAKYDEWKKLLEKLSHATLDEFAGIDDENDVHSQEYRLRCLYNEKYGFYMDDNDEYYGNQTLDSFMRNTSVGDVWYIGAVIDYHA